MDPFGPGGFQKAQSAAWHGGTRQHHGLRLQLSRGKSNITKAYLVAGERRCLSSQMRDLGRGEGSIEFLFHLEARAARGVDPGVDEGNGRNDRSSSPKFMAHTL